MIMLEKGLVNIITPAYNCAEYIPRLLDSVLAQTYPCVEMFVVDDGSTDETQDVVISYIPKFEERGYKLHYNYQTNAGQNAAINQALKWVRGEYLLYPDSDDWYKTNDAIEIMADTLSHYGDEVGIVRCQYEKIDAESMDVIGRTSFSPCNVPCNLFEDAFYGTNEFAYAPIEFMLKTKLLDSYIKNREIYINRHIGQNYQILLPYLANTKCVTIDKVLCQYFVRNNSHSHSPLNYTKAISHKMAIMECMEYTIPKIDVFEQKYKNQLIWSKYSALYNECMALDYKYSKTVEFREHFRKSKPLHLGIANKYYGLWLWTCLFNINSCKKFCEIYHQIKVIIKNIKL